jgi:hypothetical protein
MPIGLRRISGFVVRMVPARVTMAPTLAHPVSIAEPAVRRHDGAIDQR